MMTQIANTRSPFPSLVGWTRSDRLTLLTLCSAMAANRDTYLDSYCFSQAWEDLNFGDAANIPEHFEEVFTHLDPRSNHSLLEFCESLLQGLMGEAEEVAV